MNRFILILLPTICSVSGQSTFQSSADSYRRHFFLTVESDKNVTLYGWELTEKNDTLTYRAFGHLTPDKNVTFDNYEFSKTLPSKVKLTQFSVDAGVSIPTVLLHRHFSIVKQDEKRLEVLVTKDAYDSRVDKFVFTKRR